MLTYSNHTSKNGSKTEFIVSHADSRAHIDKTLQLLMSYKEFSEKDTVIIHEMVELAITKA